MAASVRKQYREKTYAPLGEYLGSLPASTAEVTLTFAEVEKIVGRGLPDSARDHRQWWENQKNGSRAYHWQDAGFKTGPVDMARETVRFYRDGLIAPRERPLAMSLQEVVTAVNERAQGRPIGGLPEWRKAHKRLDRLPSRKLFNANTLHEDYVFHVGGRSELQYNIGYEVIGEDRRFRHGIAFSLEASQSLPDVTVLLPKIERFNKYARVYPDAFDGFQMWHWPNDVGGETYPVRPIPDALAQEGFFIFIGRLQPADAISVDAILDDFDKLLPVYEYVEGEETFPARARESERDGFGGLSSKTRRAAQTSYERTAKTVEVVLRHNKIGDALAVHLEAIHGEGSTTKEFPTGNGTNIDVAVRGGGERVYYEIKTGLSAQACIRDALGQLMEYSCWPGATKADRLVVVGEAPCDRKAKAYIECLRKDFSLPIEYRQFDMKSRRLI
ncbi:MAG: DUF7662 domain-containing protein [Steroidobacter sp.]